MKPSPQEITQLLRDWRNGDASALDRLMPLVYDELRQAAKRQMARQAPGHTLQTTAVINEVYLRLVDSTDIEWEDRTHFVRFCAAVMRNILVDHFRRRRRQSPLDEAAALPQEQDINLLRLDDALDELAKLDPRASHVVNLK
ncbi:MAG: ECF-type sigma factor, partial [Blastocatellia bacterium]